MLTSSDILPLLQSTGSRASSLQEASQKHDTGLRPQRKLLCVALALLFVVVLSLVPYFNSNVASFEDQHAGAMLLAKHSRRSLPEDTSVVIPSDRSATTDFYKADGADDLIIGGMPNLDADSCSQSATNCAFNQYSGYLLANNNAEIHYVFFEADTAEDPTTRPLFIWTNGGPGCSGLIGLFTEQGPWRLMKASADSDDLKVVYNPYTWITEVNMVFLEQPYGVGFSVVDEDKEIVAGDDNAAHDMDAVIRDFLIKFPQYADADIYTTAESWGGHYVPRTALQILDNNAAGAEPYINLKGFFVGNPYTSYYENVYGFVDALFGHGLMDAVDYDEWKAECWDNAEAIDDSMTCYVIYVRAYYAAYNSNVYALDYDQCLDEEDWSTLHRQDMMLHRHAQRFMEGILASDDYDALRVGVEREELQRVYKRLLLNAHTSPLSAETSSDTTPAVGSYTYLPCSDDLMAQWLLGDDVMSALNVKVTEWSSCNDEVYYAWPESDWYRFMQDYYAEIIEKYSAELGLKLAIYSGDDDSVCAQSGTQYWLQRWTGFSAADDARWVAWKDDGEQLGGYHSVYTMDADDSFDALHFLTVRSAGHMVPTTQPQRALQILKKYLYEM